MAIEVTVPARVKQGDTVRVVAPSQTRPLIMEHVV